MDKRNFYFPNLNSLRFIAALIVMLTHIEQIKEIFHIDSLRSISIVDGYLGLMLFFVLSGFLITYLLLAEQKESKTINIKNFYIRRMLRIWPLYYLIILLAVFIFPQFDFMLMPSVTKAQIYSHLSVKLILYILLLPNLALKLYGIIPFMGATWSIGAEEQFYLLWPVCMKHIKKILFFILFVIVAYNIVSYWLANHKFDSKFVAVLNGYWQWTPMDWLAIGALFAVICYSTNKTLLFLKNILFSVYSQIILFGIVIVLALKHYSFPYFNNDIYAFLLGGIIANLALNEKRIINLEFKWLSYLGKISYGLYMYHSIAIFLAIRLLLMSNYVNNVVLYTTSILFTIIIASLSYRFFEKPFIARKLKFSGPVESAGITK